jgi:DNA invertase Pin-like site-specific DNA recombinase
VSSSSDNSSVAEASRSGTCSTVERTRAGMAAAAAHGRAGRRLVSVGDRNVKRARERKAQGLTPADIGKIIGASRATLYRYLSLHAD